MLKKITALFLAPTFYLLSFHASVYAKGLDLCRGIGLPGCENTKTDKEVIEGFVSNLISQLIQYVAVVAVISLMISGIMYLVSGGEEEKVNKAKKWIISSLVGVFLSVSAWSIIKIINNLNIF